MKENVMKVTRKKIKAEEFNKNKHGERITGDGFKWTDRITIRIYDNVQYTEPQRWEKIMIFKT